MAREDIIVIYLWHSDWGECPMCDQERRLNHAVAWWCGPVRHDIGTKLNLTDGSTQEVGGMPVCKPCHDGFYDAGRAALAARTDEGGDA